MDKIFTACSDGDLNSLKKYIATGLVDVNEEDVDGRTCLMHACREGHLPIVKYLVEQQNANPSAEDEARMTPLMHATSKGHQPVVEYLLDGQDAASHATALTYACREGHLHIVKFLMEGNIDEQWTRRPLYFAILFCHFPIARYLLECMQPQHILQARNSCLQSACYDGNLAAMEFALTEINSKHISDEDEILPHDTLCEYINRACETSLSIVKFLLQRENVRLTDEDYRNFLFHACAANNISVVKYLFEERSLDVEMKKENGRTCLMEACWNNSVPLIEYLIKERHADVNVKDKDGTTALMRACMNGNLSVVRYLVEEIGVNLDEKDNSGENCLEYAIGDVQSPVVKYLTFDCLMEFPGLSLSVDPHCMEETEIFMKSYCPRPSDLIRKQQQSIRNRIQFIQRLGLQKEWYSQHESTFHQLIPLRITHNYHFVETDNTNALCDLKVYFGEDSDETRSLVYARKGRLSQSCTFMKNLLTGEMNDVKDDPDDPGMQMVELSQDLLQDCPRDLLKQLIIFLSWSQDGDHMLHYTTDIHSREVDEELSLREILNAVKYCRTVKALGIELDLSEWRKTIEEIARAYNLRWIKHAQEGNDYSEFVIDNIPAFDSAMFDLWIEVLGENEHVMFFMLLNASRITSSSPTSIAPKCADWIKEYATNQDYRTALCRDDTGSMITRRTGYDVKTGVLSMSFPEVEKFVKRKRQRIV